MPHLAGHWHCARLVSLLPCAFVMCEERTWRRSCHSWSCKMSWHCYTPVKVPTSAGAGTPVQVRGSHRSMIYPHLSTYSSTAVHVHIMAHLIHVKSDFDQVRIAWEVPLRPPRLNTERTLRRSERPTCQSRRWQHMGQPKKQFRDNSNHIHILLDSKT